MSEINHTLTDLSRDIFKALIYNSKDLGDWVANLGETDPYKALMTFDKLTGTYQRLKEMELTGKAEDGFKINILVDSDGGRKVLTKLLQDDSEVVNGAEGAE